MAYTRLIIARWSFVGGSLLMTLLLGACATMDTGPSRLAPLNQQSSFQVPDLDVRAVSPEMEAFLDRYVGDADNLDNRAWSMVWAVTDRGILPFTV